MARDLSTNRFAAQNRKARHDFFIEDTLDAGMVLTGTEVKSLRLGRVSINEAFAVERDGEIWLHNAYFPEYESANRFNHEPRRPRKLLLKSREIKKLHGQTERQGMTLIPLSIYFNERGIANRWTFYIDKQGKIAYIDKDVAKRLETSADDMAAKLADMKVPMNHH